MVGIEIGNEIPGQQATVTISTAAQNLRSAHNAAGFNSIEVVGALIEGQASTFCRGGTPPTRVDYIADHVYCPSAVPVAWPMRRSCGRAGVSRRKRVGRKCREFHHGPEPVRGCERLPGRDRLQHRLFKRLAQQQVPNEQTYISQMVNAACQSQVSCRWRHSSSNSATYARADCAYLAVQENPN